MKIVEHFGLDDETNLRVAIELCPVLFAALRIAKRLGDTSFPITNQNDLGAALRAVGDKSGTFQAAGVNISPQDAIDHFPAHFLPVVSRDDLIRKVYMAVVIAHETSSREYLKAMRAGKIANPSSHPLDLEAL